MEKEISQKQNHQIPEIHDKVQQNHQFQKHDITELHLDREEKNQSHENILENNFSEPAEKVQQNTQPVAGQTEQNFSKADFMMQARKQAEEKPVAVRENIHLNETGSEMTGKTEAQQRIDDILAGRKTVSQEYGIKEEKNNEPEIVRPVAEESVENIEESSIYQQFLDSKKKVEAQKDRMFSGNSKNEVDNVGSFSNETSDFAFNKESHEGSRNDYVEELKEQRDTVSAIKNTLENSPESVVNNGVEVENLFGGSDFVPQNSDIVEKVELAENVQNNENKDYQSKEDYPKKDNFGSFSI